jgi:hypothetical protein
LHISNPYASKRGTRIPRNKNARCVSDIERRAAPRLCLPRHHADRTLMEKIPTPFRFAEVC